MLIQTWAMLVDAYRELCARKLFWISLGLSGLVVAMFAMLGLNERGITMLWWTIPWDQFNTGVMSRATFYKMMFQTLGVAIWLTWIAAILALITTAGFFPNMLESGAIEVHLSKPISRTRLFLTRYFTGLLFVALQVGVFTFASFFVLGLRGGLWEPRVFLAIPIVITFFSYLYSVSVLIGVKTRSTIAAILLTVLFWFFVYLLNTTDVTLVGFREGRERVVESRAGRIEQLETNTRKDVIRLKQQQEGEDAAADYEPTEEEIAAAMPVLGVMKQRQEADVKALHTLQWWSQLIFSVKTVFPKTNETTQLLHGWLISEDETAKQQAQAHEEQVEAVRQKVEDGKGGPMMDALGVQEAYRERPLWWILGTSLGFEACMMALAGFIFVRRDY